MWEGLSESEHAEKDLIFFDFFVKKKSGHQRGCRRGPEILKNQRPILFMIQISQNLLYRYLFYIRYLLHSIESAPERKKNSFRNVHIEEILIQENQRPITFTT